MVGALLTAALGALAGGVVKDKLTGPKKVISPGIKAIAYRYLGNNGVVGQIDVLAANGNANVNISEDDFNRYGPFNGGFVQNDSDENLLVLLDGQMNRFLHVAKKSSGSLANHKFNTLQLHNLSAAAPGNNEITIVVQKIPELI